MSCVELFSGGGGLALGLEYAGFKHIKLIENNADCVRMLLINRPNWNVYHGDIRSYVYTQEDKGADIVAGGFPCQSHYMNRS